VIGTSQYDAWLLRWPPGAAVTPHDHGISLGAFVVVAGELTEVRWERRRRRARTLGVGDLASIDRGVVHDVIATSPTPSLSVHVYSPPLAVMGFYEEGGARLLDRRVVLQPAGAIAPGRFLHPSMR
jgi:quercetin dioxygenase-like cupin family protein